MAKETYVQELALDLPHPLDLRVTALKISDREAQLVRHRLPVRQETMESAQRVQQGRRKQGRRNKHVRHRRLLVQLVQKPQDRLIIRQRQDRHRVIIQEDQAVAPLQEGRAVAPQGVLVLPEDNYK